MSKVIIAIHGLGNKPPQKLLEQWWLKAIQEGLQKTKQPSQKFTFKMVYWSDILYAEPLNIASRDKEDSLYLDEPYTASKGTLKPEKKKLKLRIIKFVRGVLDNIFLKEDMTLNFSDVTNDIIHSYFRELEIYYLGDESSDENQKQFFSRNAIRERLIKELKLHKDDDILLLSHSMGTIIAYEVLIENPDLIINTFVTFGSPLGFPVVVSRLYDTLKEKNPTLTKLKTPNNVEKKWFNLSDPEDMVALDSTLVNDYLANRSGILVDDKHIFNDYEINGERNPHKSFGYLRTPEMTQIINTFLNEKEKSIWTIYMGRFKNKLSGFFNRMKKK